MLSIISRFWKRVFHHKFTLHTSFAIDEIDKQMRHIIVRSNNSDNNNEIHTASIAYIGVVANQEFYATSRTLCMFNSFILKGRFFTSDEMNIIMVEFKYSTWHYIFLHFLIMPLYTFGVLLFIGKIALTPAVVLIICVSICLTIFSVCCKVKEFDKLYTNMCILFDATKT